MVVRRKRRQSKLFRSPRPSTITGLLTEQLEARHLLTTFIWDGEAPNDNWDDPQNWTLESGNEFTFNFDIDDTPSTFSQFGTNPGPELNSLGLGQGGYLTLVGDGINGQANRVSFDKVFDGASSSIVADFDFRFTSNTGPAADGVSFLLLPTATYGDSGPGTDASYASEEPNITGVFAIGFDLHPADSVNDVSAHWDGAEIVNVNLNPVDIDLDAGVFHHARIELVEDAGAGGSRVTVTLTPDIHGTPGAPITPIDSVLIPGLAPYESRVEFSARTGGLNFGGDIDNVDVQYSADVHTVATFDYQLGTNQLGELRAPEIMDGGPNGNFLRVIHDGFNNNRNRVALDRVFAGAATHVTAELDVRFTSQGGNPADGFAMLFLPTSQYGVSGPGTGLSYVAEEPNVPNTFALGFDLYPEATQNDVSVHFGSEIANVNLTPAGINLDAGVFHHVKLDLVAEGDAGSRVTVTITPDIFGNPGVPFTPIDNVLIPALRPYESRVEFAGRTGGLNLSADVDNLRLVYSSDTTSDFDGPGTPYTLFQGGSAPGPEVMSGGPDGDFLRIVHDGVNDNNNRVAFGRTLSGAAPNIRAEFDLRMSDASGNPADGVSFLLLPTSIYGANGMGTGTSFAAEEPNVPGTFAIGFDLYPGVNDVSAHWNGAEITNVSVNPADVDLNAGVFHHVVVDLSEDLPAGGSRVTVTISPDVFGAAGSPVVVIDNVLIPGLFAYENRVEFAGRTGGLNHSADIDNLSVSYSGSPLFDSSVATRASFESNDLNFTPVQIGSNPGPEYMTGGPAGGFLRIVHDGVNSQVNRVAFDRVHAGTAQTMVADFDFRFTSTDAAADGMSFLLLPTSTYGNSGPGTDGGYASEEPNVANVFAVGFDLHPAATTNDVSVHWNGMEIMNVIMDSDDINLDNGMFHHAHVELTEDAANGGSRVSVTLTRDIYGTPGNSFTPIDNVLIPGLSPYENRPEFSARTGGLNFSADIDNFQINYLSDGTIQSFDGSGTPFTLNQWGTEPGPAVTPGGPTGSFLRLTYDGVNSNVNSASFDRTHIGAAASTVAEFDFRLTSDNGEAADGMAFALLPTSIYNNSGFGYAWGAVVPEEPNVPDVFSIGFDVYPAGQATNDVSAHWNGTEIVNVRLSQAVIDLDAKVFHHAKVVLTEDAANGGSRVSVVLTPNIHGNAGDPITAIDNVLIPGLVPYESRVEFAARTGGLNLSADIDNLLVDYSGTVNQTFDGGGVGFVATQYGADPGAGVTAGGPDGSFLRIVHDGVNSNKNSVSFPRTHVGASSTVLADFDFRFTSNNGQAADGMAFALIPTSAYGTSGPGIDWGPITPEEPNVTGVFAVGFDFYPAASNDVSAHWNGTEISNVTIDPAMLSLDAGLFHHATISLVEDSANGGSRVTVTLTPGQGGAPITPIDNLLIPGLAPYESRIDFAARTGGLNHSADIDNLVVKYDGSIDTDSAGFNYNFATNQLADRITPQILHNGPSGSFMRLVHDGNNNNRNRVTFDRTFIGAADVVNAQFDFRLTSNTGEAADGFGFLLLPTATYGNSGPGSGLDFVAEEPNLAGAFAIGFDVYPAGAGTNDVSAHWNGSEIINVTVDPALVDLNSGQFHRAEIRLIADEASGGSRATVLLTPNIYSGGGQRVVAIADVVIPGLSPYEARVEFAARTGGLNLSTDLDNLVVNYGILNEGETEPDTFPGPADTAVFDDRVPGGGSVNMNGDQAVRNLILENNGANAYTFDGGSLTVSRIEQSGGASNDIAATIHGTALTIAVENGALRLGSTANSIDADSRVSVAAGTQLTAVSDGSFSLGDAAIALNGSTLNLEGSGSGTYSNDVTVNGQSTIQVGAGITSVAMNDLSLTAANQLNVVGSGGGQQVEFTGNVTIVGDLTTTNDFEGDTPFTSSQFGANPGIEFRSQGPSGGYLRVVHDGVNSQSNRVPFNQTHAGAPSDVVADFDFRFSSAGEAADGLAFLLLPTSIYGSSGVGSDASYASEEPNLGDVFAVGFDLYPAGEMTNDVSAHWNFNEIVNVRIPATDIDLDAGIWHHARIELHDDAANGGSRVTVVLSPDVYGAGGPTVTAIDNVLIPGLTPYESRVELSGRTGGLDFSADIDNLYVDFGSGDATATVGTFDHNMTTRQFVAPFSPQINGAGPTGNYLRLEHDGQNDNRNRATFDRAFVGAPDSISADLDFRFTSNTGAAADGISLRLLPTSVYGTTGPGTDIAVIAEEPNLPGVLAVAFDLHPAATVNDVSVHYGSELMNVTLDPLQIDLDAGIWHHLHVDWVPNTTIGGVDVTVTLTPDFYGIPGAALTPISINIPGATLYEARPELAGRTGGLNFSGDLDNLVINYSTGGGKTINTDGIDVLISGSINALQGAPQLIKTGDGALILAGEGNYDGTTNINSGTLRVVNTSGSATGAGPVIIADNATLQGNGTIAGPVTVNSGGTLSPGLGGPDTINTGDLTLEAGSNAIVQITSTGNDTTVVTGTASVGGAIGQATIEDGFRPTSQQAFVTINNDGTDPVIGEFAFLPEGTEFTLNGLTFTITYIYDADTGTPGAGNDVALIYTNTPPTVDAGGPYALSEGGSITLSATGDDADGDSLTYSWDLNGDGTFGDATGAGPVITAAQLEALNASRGDGPNSYSIAVRVSDGDLTGEDTGTVNVTNVAPTAGINGPTSGNADAPLSFTLTANDPSLADRQAGFTYQINWGDGDTESIGPGAAGSVPASHVYASTGTFTVSVTATDKDGGVSAAATLQVNISPSSPVIVVGNDIIVTGSDDVNDRVIIQRDRGGSVSVRFNDERFGPFPTNMLTVVKVFAGGGNDRVSVGTCITTELHGEDGNDLLFGGSCNDTIFGGDGRDSIQAGEGDNTADGGDGNDVVTGRSGNDVLAGGPGNDDLIGGSGDDMLFGDEGNDRLIGGGNNDLLVGGQGNDTLSGQGEIDVLIGNAGNDLLLGGDGDDLLLGGSGTDATRGERGLDALIGGEATNEDDRTALALVMLEWTLDRSFPSLGTLLDDGERDPLLGGGGSNEFHRGQFDVVLDADDNDTITGL